MRTTADFSGFITPAQAAVQPYLYLPIDVPLGCTRIDVSYHWHAPGADDRATIDIGMFDVRGIEPFTGGFRGWSGSARRTFFIAREAATPGYIAGPMPAGAWSIILGAYEIPEPSVHWFVTAEVESSASPAAPPAGDGPRSPALAASDAPPPRQGGDTLRWYRGDLHTHTEHSDGENTIPELAGEAARLGLDFLAVTDHNTVTHHAEIDSREWPVLLLPGEEVTMYRGHCNVWGLREWVDFRFVTDDEVHRLLRWADERRAPISINHPKDQGPPWLFDDGAFAIREVWQAPWRWYNWATVRAWDEQLASGSRIVPVGGSDAHGIPPTSRHPHGPGTPTTWLQAASLSEAGLLEAITGGRTSISDGPEGPFVTLHPTDDDGFEVAFARAEGCTLSLVADGEARWRTDLEGASGAVLVPRGLRFDRYLRAELRVPAPKDREDVRALSAPVYRE
jgi:hypothetical protein